MLKIAHADKMIEPEQALSRLTGSTRQAAGGLIMSDQSTVPLVARQSTCKECGITFVKKQLSAKGLYCSRACKNKAQGFLNRRPVACRQCGQSFVPHGRNPGVYCSISCKAKWQQTQKPVDYDWLYEKYIIELRTANDISKIVKRNPKRVWEWLKGYGIPTRPRGVGYDNGHRFRVGHKLGVGRKASDATREKLRQIRIKDGHVPYLKNGVHWLKGKTGPICPSWKGGVTPERQSVYSSDEWKAAVKTVWIRDNAECQRCGKRNRPDHRFAFDVHHIVSFANKRLRCDPLNLVLLCEECHYWVHSKLNIEKCFIKEAPGAA